MLKALQSFELCSNKRLITTIASKNYESACTKFVEKVQGSIMIAVGLKQEFKSCNDHQCLFLTASFMTSTQSSHKIGVKKIGNR